MTSKIPCYYAHGGLNYKNGFATVCPISGARLKEIDAEVPSDFWNNEYFTEYRKMLDKGIWPNDCGLCKNNEENNIKSMRQDYPADLTHYDFNTGRVNFGGLKHVELRFSNSCNMACLHCSNVYSSKWGSRLKNYVPDEVDKEYHLEQLLGTQHRVWWPERDKNIRKGSKDPGPAKFYESNIDLRTGQVLDIVTDLNKNFPNIEKIDFAGGEVLYQKQFFPCLHKLAEHPNAKNILIFFHSNFNADFKVKDLSDALKPFGKSKIMISVDAGKNIYPYFRDGSWKKLKQNLHAFNKVNNFTEIDAVCTTSVYQIMDIEDVITSLLELNLNGINSSIVYTPSYINPALMMRHFSKEVIEDLNATRHRIKMIEMRRKLLDDPTWHRSYKGNSFEDIESALRSIDNIEEYLTNYKGTKEKDWEGFLHYSRKIDTLWKKDFNNHFIKYKKKDNKMERTHLLTYESIPYNEELDVNEPVTYLDQIAEKQKHLEDVSELRRKVDEIGVWEERIKELHDKKDYEAHVKYLSKAEKEQITGIDDKKIFTIIKNHHSDELRKRVLAREDLHKKRLVQDEIRKIILLRDTENKESRIKKGIKTFEHDGLDIPLNPEWTNIAIMLSGGADSASLAYILCTEIERRNQKITLDIFSSNRCWSTRPWQGDISKGVYDWFKNRFPNIIGERITTFVAPQLEHGVSGEIIDGKSGEQILMSEFNRYMAHVNDYNAIYNATTANMPGYKGLRMLNRDEIATKYVALVKPTHWILHPYVHTAKDWVIKQYKDLNILELLNLTRSCEGDSDIERTHFGMDATWYKQNKKVPKECGVCYWCREREWAMECNEL